MQECIVVKTEFYSLAQIFTTEQTSINVKYSIIFVNLFLYVVFVWLVILKLRPTPAVAWSSEILYQSTTILLSLLYLTFGKWRQKKL